MADLPTPKMSPSIAAAVQELGRGRMVVLEDDSCAHLAVGAEFATAEQVNFMAKEGRGIICLALTSRRCEELGLELIPARFMADAAEPKAFTVSIEAKEGITTGISAADRARTIAVAVDPTSSEEDIVAPGHVFPLQARPGGVLERAGEAESAVDLARLADVTPAVALCTIIADSGDPATGSELAAFCRRHGLVQVSIKELLAYRKRSERSVGRSARSLYRRAVGFLRGGPANAALSLDAPAAERR